MIMIIKVWVYTVLIALNIYIQLQICTEINQNPMTGYPEGSNINHQATSKTVAPQQKPNT